MGKEILKGLLAYCAVFVAGLLYGEWGSFEYNVPGDRPALVHSDGTPIR